MQSSKQITNQLKSFCLSLIVSVYLLIVSVYLLIVSVYLLIGSV